MEFIKLYIYKLYQFQFIIGNVALPQTDCIRCFIGYLFCWWATLSFIILKMIMPEVTESLHFYAVIDIILAFCVFIIVTIYLSNKRRFARIVIEMRKKYKNKKWPTYYAVFMTLLPWVLFLIPIIMV